MTFRRRNRWFRRFAIGLAFATFAAPAAARNDHAAPVTAGAIVTGGAIENPYGPALPRQGEAQAGPDGGLSVSPAAVTPASEARASQPAESTWAPTRNEAISLGLGALALALGVGLAIGYPRRPRIAGF